ncbi:MAG: hypothetical protein KBA06_01475 [Saprospiraceae bacterium]|nr:hypothetical protein [Saprospiraceae bacterium]
MISYNANAQAESAAKVVWGKKYNYQSGLSINEKTILDSNNKLYVIRVSENQLNSKNNKIVIESYNPNLKLINAEKISLKFKGKHREFIDVIIQNDTLWMLTAFYNQRENIKYFFKEKINSKKLTLSNKLEKIAEIKTSDKYQNDVIFSYITSKDSSKTLIVVQENHEKNYNLTVLDRQNREIWYKDCLMLEDKNEIIPYLFKVSNDGVVYSLNAVVTKESKNYLGLIRKVQSFTNRKNLFLAFKNNGTIVNKIEIASDQYAFSNLSFGIVNKEEVALAGMYGIDRGRDNFFVEGICYLRYNINNGENIVTSFVKQQFNYAKTSSNYNSNTSWRSSQNESMLYNGFQTKELITRNDGGVLFIAEQMFVEYVSTTPYSNFGYYNSPYYYSNTVDNYYYNFNDIIVCNISPEGNLDWKTVIPKKQSTSNDNGYFSSFAFINAKNKLYFVYNDNVNNLNSNQKKRTFDNANNSLLVLSEIDREGILKSSPLLYSKEEKITIIPNACKQIGSKELLLYGEHKNVFQFGIMSVD